MPQLYIKKKSPGRKEPRAHQLLGDQDYQKKS